MKPEDPDAPPKLLGPPLSDADLDVLERQAFDVYYAVKTGDLDTAYIIAATAENPALLALYVAATPETIKRKERAAKQAAKQGGS